MGAFTLDGSLDEGNSVPSGADVSGGASKGHPMSAWSEWQINAAVAVTWLLWFLGLGLIGLTCVNVLAHPYAAMGIALVAFGCMTQIGSWMRQLDDHQRNAFELGRDSVSQMRR